MMMQTTHTTRVFETSESEGVEIELQLDLGPAEPDVGIAQPYIDNWSVIAVEGNTDAEVCLEVEQTILEEYDDDKFVDRLYDEGALD